MFVPELYRDMLAQRRMALVRRDRARKRKARKAARISRRANR